MNLLMMKIILIVIYAHDNPISFKQYHDKLSNYEVYLNCELPHSDVAFIIANFANKVIFNNKSMIYNQQDNRSNNHSG